MNSLLALNTCVLCGSPLYCQGYWSERVRRWSTQTFCSKPTCAMSQTRMYPFGYLVFGIPMGGSYDDIMDLVRILAARMEQGL